ncbi:MAG: hypothetical protein V4722_08355 [Bacteroidota bacterium]
MLLAIAAVCMMPKPASAQSVAINNDSSVANAAAMLDIKSNSKGLLIPRLPKANRPAPPTDGLLIYQTDDTPGFYYYKNGSWNRLVDSSSGPQGSIIPFSSGTAGKFDFFVGNNSSGEAVGFGDHFATLNPPNVPADTVGGGFVVPRNGTVNAISLQCRLKSASPAYESRFRMLLYKSSGGSGSYAEIAAISGPAIPASSPGGFITVINSILNVPLLSGDKLLLVTYFTRTGTGIFTMMGHVSGGLNIY